MRPPGAEAAAADITRDTKAFTAAIRTRIFTFLRGLVNRDFEAALSTVAQAFSTVGSTGASPADAPETWTPARLQQILEAYHAEHEYIRLDPEARNLRHTYVIPSEDKRTWRVQQMLVDPEEHNDWVAEFEMDLAKSRELGEPTIHLLRLGPLKA